MISSHPIQNQRPKHRGQTLAAAEFNRLVHAVKAALRSSRPRGFVSSDFALVRQRPSQPTPAFFPGQVYAAMLVGSPNRWLYAIREMWWDLEDDDWILKPGGRTSEVGGDDFARPAVNGCEAGNDGTGIEVVGVDFDGEPLASSTFEVIEIKNLPVVPVFPLATAGQVFAVGPKLPDGSGPTPAFWFSIPNAIDGSCPEPAGIVSPTGCSCASCCLSANVAGPGIAVLHNGTIVVRIGDGLGFDADGNVFIDVRQAQPVGTFPLVMDEPVARYLVRHGTIAVVDDNLDLGGGELRNWRPVVDSLAATTTLTAANDVVLVDASAGAVTIDLPAVATIPNKQYEAIKIDASANPVTVDGDGSEPINGVPTYVLNMQYESVTIVNDSIAAWYVK